MFNVIAHITQETHAENSQLSHWSITSPIVVVVALGILTFVAYRVYKYAKSKIER